MSVGTPDRAAPATLDELYGVLWKAELIDGAIVPMSPTGIESVQAARSVNCTFTAP